MKHVFLMWAVALAVGFLGFNLGKDSARQQFDTLTRHAEELQAADADLKAADAHLQRSCAGLKAANDKLMIQADRATAQMQRDTRVMLLCKDHFDNERKGLTQ